MLDPIADTVVARDHTCLLTGNQVRCWGNNNRGQLSIDLPTQPVETPESVPPASLTQPGPDAFGIGRSRSCSAHGFTVACWGEFDDTPDSRITDLTDAMGGSITQLAVGNAHTCALVDGGAQFDDAVYCWGRDEQGELGEDPTGSSTDASGETPLVVTNLPAEVQEIAAGISHTCAVAVEDDQPRVWCWGDNADNQGANPDVVLHSAQPIMVSDDELLPGPLRQLSAGARHTCVIDGDDQLWCWGANTKGQADPRVADAAEPNVAVATRVQLVEGEPLRVQHVTTGDQYTCAIDLTGRVWCWGCNEEGQLGGGTTGASGCTR